MWDEYPNLLGYFRRGCRRISISLRSWLFFDAHIRIPLSLLMLFLMAPVFISLSLSVFPCALSLAPLVISLSLCFCPLSGPYLGGASYIFKSMLYIIRCGPASHGAGSEGGQQAPGPHAAQPSCSRGLIPRCSRSQKVGTWLSQTKEKKENWHKSSQAHVDLSWT